MAVEVFLSDCYLSHTIVDSGPGWKARATGIVLGRKISGWGTGKTPRVAVAKAMLSFMSRALEFAQAENVALDFVGMDAEQLLRDAGEAKPLLTTEEVG